MSFDHDRCSELLGPYLRGELDPASSREVGEHLDGCDPCRSELTALEALAATEPPPLSELQKARLRQSLPGSRRDRNLAPLGVAALIVVILAVGGLALGILPGGGGGSGSSGSAASGGGGAVNVPRAAAAANVAFDPAAGMVTSARLRRLASSKPFLELSSKGGAESSQSLAAGARDFEPVPPSRQKEVTSCSQQVAARGGHSPVLLYAGVGKDEHGAAVIILGFVYSSTGGSQPDHYAFWIWPEGKCGAAPELYLSGMLDH